MRTVVGSSSSCEWRTFPASNFDAPDVDLTVSRSLVRYGQLERIKQGWLSVFFNVRPPYMIRDTTKVWRYGEWLIPVCAASAVAMMCVQVCPLDVPGAGCCVIDVFYCDEPWMLSITDLYDWEGFRYEFASPRHVEGIFRHCEWARPGRGEFTLLRLGDESQGFWELWTNDCFGSATHQQVIAFADLHELELS